MSELFDLVAEARTDFGKATSRRLRRESGKVPAVIYGAKKEPVHIMLPGNTINKALEIEGFYSQILNVKIDGKKQKVILKDLQRHPFKPVILHMDFLRVSATEKLTVNIPLHFVGEDSAPGVAEGGVFTHSMNELEIRCLPADLPEFIEVDVSKMKLDDVIHLTEITVTSGIEIVALAHGTDQAHDHAVISLHEPRLQAEPVEEEEPETAEAAEGEAAPEGEEEKPSEESSDEGKSEE